MEKYCKIISVSKAENCVGCLNRFQHFFSSKPFIHQVFLWCSGHLLKSIKPTDGVSPQVSKGKIKSWFSPCCTASSSPMIPTQHSSTSEAGSTSEEALGLSTAGKVNRCSRLPAHLDGIITTGHGECAAHHAHTVHTLWLCYTHYSPQRHCLPYGRIFRRSYNQWAYLIFKGQYCGFFARLTEIHIQRFLCDIETMTVGSTAFKNIKTTWMESVAYYLHVGNFFFLHAVNLHYASMTNWWCPGSQMWKPLWHITFFSVTGQSHVSKALWKNFLRHLPMVSMTDDNYNFLAWLAWEMNN